MKTIMLSTHPRIRSAILATAFSFALGLGRAAEAPPKPLFADAAPVCSCEDLLKVALPNTMIDSAAIDPTDGSCRVTATVTHPPSGDRVKVFIGLPTKNWNGRFRGTGGGGFVGGNVNNLRGPVADGYATGATDTGHEGGSGSFALDANGRLNWQAIQDNAYLGIHDMTVVGKTLTQAFYGKAPRYSYFVGGSTGGRQGLSEAQRYPNDYDGGAIGDRRSDGLDDRLCRGGRVPAWRGRADSVLGRFFPAVHVVYRSRTRGRGGTWHRQLDPEHHRQHLDLTRGEVAVRVHVAADVRFAILRGVHREANRAVAGRDSVGVRRAGLLGIESVERHCDVWRRAGGSHRLRNR